MYKEAVAAESAKTGEFDDEMNAEIPVEVQKDTGKASKANLSNSTSKNTSTAKKSTNLKKVEKKTPVKDNVKPTQSRTTRSNS